MLLGQEEDVEEPGDDDQLQRAVPDHLDYRFDKNLRS